MSKFAVKFSFLIRADYIFSPGPWALGASGFKSHAPTFDVRRSLVAQLLIGYRSKDEICGYYPFDFS